MYSLFRHIFFFRLQCAYILPVCVQFIVLSKCHVSSHCTVWVHKFPLILLYTGSLGGGHKVRLELGLGRLVRHGRLLGAYVW